MTTNKYESEINYQPFNENAEQCVIGALLTNKDAITEVSAIITEDDFFFYPNKAIYRAICAIDEKRQPVEVSLVIQQLTITEQLEAIGGLSYLAKLAHDVSAPKNILHYAKNMKDKSREREIIQIAQAMKNEIITSEDDTDTKINNALAMPLMVETSAAVEKDSVQFLKEAIDNLKYRHEMDGKITGFVTKYTEIDKRFQGLQPGQLMIIAARPAMGKTTWALNLAINALFDGRPGATVFFSMEMTGKELMDKMICSVGGVDYGLFKQGFPKGNPDCDDQWPKVMDASTKLRSANGLVVDDRSTITLQQIRAKAIRIKRKHGSVKAIFVDYLTLIRTPGKDNRVLEVGALSRGLKSLAKEIECPVICLAQLSRKVEERADKKPMMSDLRDSGEIEQDADIISFIYRDDVYNPNSAEPGIAQIITVKNRAGETGIDYLQADLRRSKFKNLDLGYRPPEPDKKKEETKYYDNKGKR